MLRKNLTEEQILVESQLNSASTAFGLKLPKPAGSIRKHVPVHEQGQKAIRKLSQPLQAQKSSGLSNLNVEAKDALGPDSMEVDEPCAQVAQSGQEKSPSFHKPSLLRKLRPRDYDFSSDASESYRGFIARDGWAMLERELKLQELEDPLPLVKMPLITLQQLKKHLLEKFGHQPNRFVTVLGNESSVEQHQADVDLFIAEVERTRLLAVFAAEPDATHKVDDAGQVVGSKEEIEVTGEPDAALEGTGVADAAQEVGSKEEGKGTGEPDAALEGVGVADAGPEVRRMEEVEGAVEPDAAQKVEGAGVPDAGQEVAGAKETPVITLSTFSGLVLIFNGPLLLPSKIQSFLTDVAFVKISSGPDRDCRTLQKVGIRLRGWIHSGAVYRALLNNEAEFGLEAQARLLEAEGYVKAAPELSNPSESGSFDKKQRLTIDNVLVPIAVTQASALHFGLKRGYPEDKQMFPVIWEAIDLVRNRVPEDLVDLASDPLKNWMAGMTPECREKRHRTVNEAGTLLGFRRMCADFVEVFDPSFDLHEAAKVPHRLFVDTQGERLELPAAKSVTANWNALLEERCKNCAKSEHEIEQCPELKDGQAPVCVYPHDGVPDLPPHSTRLCPILHYYCLICMVQGHHPEVHVRQDFSHRELRERFFQHAHLGLLTSMPYLTLFPEARAMMNSVHWRGGYQGLQIRRDPITRYQLGITEYIDFALDPDLAERNQADRAKLVAVKAELVKRNAEADDPRDMKPIPRDLLKQEKENMVKQARLVKAEPDR